MSTKTILHLDSSSRSAEFGSVSRLLSSAVVDHLQKLHPDAVVIRRDLAVDPVPALGPLWQGASFTPPDARTVEQQAELAVSDALAAELLAADFLVIGTPMYNFSIAAPLKAYIDQVVRVGVTINYGANGPVGLATNTRVIVTVGAGGDYSQPPMQSFDFVEPYLRHVFGFLGAKEATFVWGGGRGEAATTSLERAHAAIARID